MYSAFITDNPSPILIERLNNYGIHTTSTPTITHDELKKHIHKYDVIVIRSTTKITAEIIEKATKLKVIGRAGVGTDNIDTHATKHSKIKIINTPTSSSRTTAEFAIGLLLSLARKIPSANQSVHNNQWNRSIFMGTEVFGKTLGIIGFGNIGSIVCEIATAIGLKVVAYDPYTPSDLIKQKGGTKINLEILLQSSDFITLHTILNNQTYKMINQEAFRKMKNTAQIINCSRGDIIDEDHLITALKTGQIAGAALDVFSVEPIINNSLFSIPGLILTPHLGASTKEAQKNIARDLADKIHETLNAF